jgi:hypothetical protein
MRCTRCDEIVPKNSVYCPHCGKKKVKSAKSSESEVVGGPNPIAILAIGLGIAIAIIFFMNNSSPFEGSKVDSPSGEVDVDTGKVDSYNAGIAVANSLSSYPLFGRDEFCANLASEYVVPSYPDFIRGCLSVIAPDLLDGVRGSPDDISETYTWEPLRDSIVTCVKDWEAPICPQEAGVTVRSEDTFDLDARSLVNILIESGVCFEWPQPEETSSTFGREYSACIDEDEGIINVNTGNLNISYAIFDDDYVEWAAGDGWVLNADLRSSAEAAAEVLGGSYFNG